MKVTSVNNRITERPGYRLVAALPEEGFFRLIYQRENPMPPGVMDQGRDDLSVYFNQDGKEVFTVEHENAD